MKNFDDWANELADRIGEKERGEVITPLATPDLAANIAKHNALLERFRQQRLNPALGVDELRAEEIGQLAALDPCTATNAKPIDSSDLENLFRAAVRDDISLL